MTSVSKRHSKSEGFEADEKVWPKGCEKDATVWYEDGNVVLIANGTGFRLYKGILISVSPVFQDMFSLAKPDNDSDGDSKEDSVDGCPVTLVRLTDSPEDLRHFLVMITTGFVELLSRNTLLPFARLAATIRIAHKYQAAPIVNAAASRLRRFFTLTVVMELHALSGTHGAWRSLWDWKQRQCGVRVPMDGATGVEAVHLARLLGYDAMLPFALLCCSLSDPLELRNGVRRGDGTVVRLSDGDYLKCVRTVPELTQTLHTLGEGVMRRCARETPGGRSCGCKRVLAAMSRAYAAEAFSGPLMDGFVWFQWRSEPPKAYAERAERLCEKCSSRLMKTFYETFNSDLLLVVDENTGCVQIRDSPNDW